MIRGKGAGELRGMEDGANRNFRIDELSTTLGAKKTDNKWKCNG